MRLKDFVKTFRSVIVTGSTTVANQFVDFFGGIFAGAAVGGIAPIALLQAASVAIDVSRGNDFILALTTNAAFVLANPTNPPPAGFGQEIRITISNTSGGAHGAGTFGTLYKISGAGVPAIADTTNRTFAFRWNGTNWVMLYQTAADVAN